jgi:site-specific recombinase XerD
VRASSLPTAVTRAAAQAGLDKPGGGQTLRHSGATHVRKHGVHIRVLQERLGHAEVQPTERYTPVMARNLPS